jgi:hypothetical protein
MMAQWKNVLKIDVFLDPDGLTRLPRRLMLVPIY